MDLTLKVAALILLLVAYPPSVGDRCADAGGNRTAAAVPTAAAEAADAAEATLDFPLDDVVRMSSMMVINILICLLVYYWTCFANNYLHWAALATWVLMNIQGIAPTSIIYSTHPIALCYSHIITVI